MSLASNVLEHIEASNKRILKRNHQEECGVSSYYPRTDSSRRARAPTTAATSTTHPLKRPKAARPPSPMQLSDPAEPGSPAGGSWREE